MDHKHTMDPEERWERASPIKTPPLPLARSPDAVQPNNPGCRLMTFPSVPQTPNVIASSHPATNTQDTPLHFFRPNASGPFNPVSASPMHGSAGSVGLPGSLQNATGINVNPGAASQGPQPEFSIYVADLAPQTTDLDLMAVFRNPVLGLRQDKCEAGLEYDTFFL